MGYYTNYNLRINENTDLTCRELDKLTGYTWDKINRKSFCIEEPAKWYESHENMIELCKKEKFKDVLFELHCKGEEGEEYKQFYKNGKHALIEPIITWPEFHEEMLK